MMAPRNRVGRDVVDRGRYLASPLPVAERQRNPITAAALGVPTKTLPAAAEGRWNLSPGPNWSLAPAWLLLGSSSDRSIAS